MTCVRIRAIDRFESCGGVSLVLTSAAWKVIDGLGYQQVLATRSHNLVKPSLRGVRVSAYRRTYTSFDNARNHNCPIPPCRSYRGPPQFS